MTSAPEWMCLVLEVSSDCELPVYTWNCFPETTAKCMWAKLHVPDICVWDQTNYGEICTVCGSDIASYYLSLKKCHLSHIIFTTTARNISLFWGYDICSYCGLNHWEHEQIKISLPWGRWCCCMNVLLEHPVCLCHALFAFTLVCLW